MITSSQIGRVFTFWLIEIIIATIFILPLGLRFGTPSVQKTKFFVRNYWD